MTEQLARIMEKAEMLPHVKLEHCQINKYVTITFLCNKSGLTLFEYKVSYDELFNLTMGYDIQPQLDAIERALDQLQEGVA
ncbi:hypothetical protein [Alkalihalobacillus trypoxylicola]|uniref:DUF1797 domain-containing protein n=1 Tax=Alkalihalobacillus trypoxylicola TaxID=519424 RepID=A0A162D553_9BACI|nr:hypothetical protein [Alkalihalobacillus trypoxylicola]KYG28136.1 hypothetical protein AZF04_09540 [Alkalihalobacillus trypoxylicola]